MPLTDAQKTAAAYAHFTLEEWKLMATALETYYLVTDLKVARVNTVLAKFPSAVL